MNVCKACVCYCMMMLCINILAGLPSFIFGLKQLYLTLPYPWYCVCISSTHAFYTVVKGESFFYDAKKKKRKWIEFTQEIHFNGMEFILHLHAIIQRCLCHFLSLRIWEWLEGNRLPIRLKHVLLIRDSLTSFFLLSMAVVGPSIRNVCWLIAYIKA